MKKQITTNDVISSVFYLLDNPSKISDFKFQGCYVDKHSYELGKLYDTIKDLCIKKNSLINEETAIKLYNEKFNSELTEDQKQISATKIKELYSTYNKEIEPLYYDEILREVTYSGWTRHNIAEKAIAFNDYNDGKMSVDKLISEIDSITKKAEFTRPCSSDNCVFEPFDKSLRILIDNQIMSTNIAELDKYLCGGLTKRSVTGFLTTTGGGKSTLLFSLAGAMLRKGYNVCFVNLEMNNYEVNSRIIAATMQNEDFTYAKILSSLTDDNFMDNLEYKWNFAVQGNFTLISRNQTDDFGLKYDAKWLTNILLTTEEKRSKDLGKEFKFDVVIVDYLFLMSTTASGNKNERVDQTFQRLTQEFHTMCMNNNWAGISVFQTNRSGESKQEDGKDLGFDAIGDSYGSARDIEFLFSFRQDSERKGIILKNLKSRHYDGKKEPFTMTYNKPFMCYTAIPFTLDDSNSRYKSAWRDYVSLDIVKNNLTGKDIALLLKKYNMEVSEKTISLFFKDNNIKRNIRKSTVDWNTIDLINELQENQKKLDKKEEIADLNNEIIKIDGQNEFIF